MANFLGGWLDLITDFFGIQINLKIRCSAHVSRPGRLNSANKVQPDLVFKKLFNAFWIFLRLGNSAWDFFGVNFGPGFFWVLLEALGTFWGFDLWPHSIIPAA